VDAGGAAGCLFYVPFTGEGKHRIEVRLGSGSPRDDDPADNAAATEVEVYASNELFYVAELSDTETYSRYFTRSTYLTRDGAGFETEEQYQDDIRRTYASRTVSFTGWSPRNLSRRPRIVVEEETNGTQVFSGAYELADMPENPGASCGQGVDGASGVSVFACTDGYVTYLRTSNRAIYHSSGFSRTFYPSLGWERVYQWNQDSEFQDGLPLTELGSNYTIRMRLDDGTTQFWADVTFPLSTWDYRQDLPFSCQSYPWGPGTTKEYCTQQEHFTQVTGGRGWSYP
jgi:hypothetical protein